jgi:hypothetical protein
VTNPGGASLFFENLTIQNGEGTGWGGGMEVYAWGTPSEIHVNDVWFLGNSALSPGWGDLRGGALYLELGDSAYAEVTGNRFIDNAAGAPSPPASSMVGGGGVYFNLHNSSELAFSGNHLEGNACISAESTGTAEGCGFYLRLGQTSAASIHGNSVLDSSVTGFDSVEGLAGYVLCGSSVPSSMERNRWQGGTAVTADPSPELLYVECLDDSVVTQRSSLIADGPSQGLEQVNQQASTWRGVNLTAAGNGAVGIRTSDAGGGATRSLYNTISFGNGGDDLVVTGSSELDDGDDEDPTNLIGPDPASDPDFVNPIGGYYQLQKGSPAVDEGTGAPPGGISTEDLAGDPRAQGAAVDVGAYEGTELVWIDGFESGDTTAWSSTVPGL